MIVSNLLNLRPAEFVRFIKPNYDLKLAEITFCVSFEAELRFITIDSINLKAVPSDSITIYLSF